MLLTTSYEVGVPSLLGSTNSANVLAV